MPNYRHDGAQVLVGVISDETVARLVETVEACESHAIENARPAVPGVDPCTVTGSGAEERYKRMIRGDVLMDADQTFVSLYPHVAVVASRVAGDELRLAPIAAWPAAVNANLYMRPGDRQGWHVDTNDVSVLLFLTSTRDASSPLRVRRNASAPVCDVHAEPGDMIVLDGTFQHCVPAITGAHRVNVSFNLYRRQYHRPASVDQFIYGMDSTR